MVKSMFLKGILFAAVLGLLGGCDSSERGPLSADPAEQVAVVGNEDVRGASIAFFTSGMITRSEGGTLSLQNSEFIVPPNAVPEDVIVTWTIENTSPPAGLTNPLRRVYTFMPHGLEFEVSTTANISFEDAGLGQNDPHDYRFYYYNEEEESWEPQQTRVSAGNQGFVVELNHFSRYAFGR